MPCGTAGLLTFRYQMRKSRREAEWFMWLPLKGLRHLW
jgi:hypothetical protein